MTANQYADASYQDDVAVLRALAIVAYNKRMKDKAAALKAMPGLALLQRGSGPAVSSFILEGTGKTIVLPEVSLHFKGGRTFHFKLARISRGVADVHTVSDATGEMQDTQHLHLIQRDSFLLFRRPAGVSGRKVARRNPSMIGVRLG